MAIIKKTIATVGGNGGGDRKPHTLQVGLQTGPTTVNISMKESQKPKTRIPYDSDLAPLGIYPKEAKPASYRHPAYPCFLGHTYHSQVKGSA